MAYKERHEMAEVPISTLIDVVFLLIIFFVVTASIQRDVVDLQVKLAKTEHLPIPEDSPELQKLTITVNLRHLGPDQEPRLSVSGNTVSYEQLEYMLKKARYEHGNIVPVIIRAGEDVRWKWVDKVNNVVTAAGLVQVRHASQALQEKAGG